MRGTGSGPGVDDSIDVGKALTALAAAVDGGGEVMRQVLRVVRRFAAAPVAVFDMQGSVLESEPSRFRWVSPFESPKASGQSPAEMMTVTPIEIDGDQAGVFCVARKGVAEELTDFIAGLLSLELARRQAHLAERRELAGEVIEDVVHGAISGREAERRLARFGVSLGEPNVVVVGEVDVPPARLRNFPWNLNELGTELVGPHLRAIIGSQIVMVAPSEDAAKAIARRMLEHLSNLSRTPRIGIGSAHAGVGGLRLSYFQARDALAAGAGISPHETMNLPTLLMTANADIDVGEIAEVALRPLLDYDDEHRSELVLTLREYFASDCAPAATAEALHVHRNTVFYRLNLIESLTGRDLSDFMTRAHFWLATVAYERTGLQSPEPDPEVSIG